MTAKMVQRVGMIATAAVLFGGTVAGCSSAALAPVNPTPVGGQPSAARGVPTNAGMGRGAPVSSGAVAGSVAAAPVGVSQATSSMAQNPAQVIPPVPTPGANLIHGIVVQGTGRVRVKPDQATITAGVQTRATTAQEAQAQNNATMQKVVDAIKAAGVPAENIQTTGVSLYPIIEQGQVVTGYNATNNVSVVVDQLDKVGAVLDGATKAGANVEGSVRFGLKDDSAAKNAALQAAAADAKAKANALASALGLKISSIESVSEGAVSVPIVIGPKYVAAAASAAPSVPVEAGQMDVSAQVTIAFGY